ncbi:hypothetical protein [Radiobacillus sp. PE A8.2]|uniref:hypothetical protein n=1 Tax=Radiobacillus sp. PE A8.2 TaxID=3380349 RepID=UPI00388FFD8D
MASRFFLIRQTHAKIEQKITATGYKIVTTKNKPFEKFKPPSSAHNDIAKAKYQGNKQRA